MYDFSHSHRPREPILNLPGSVGLLIGVNIVIHVVLWAAPEAAMWWTVNAFGFIPAAWTGGLPGEPNQWAGPILHQFLHGGWLHLGINMVMLAAFGAGVVRALGWPRFLILYFLSGIAGAVAHAWVYPDSVVPVIGASGAISGLFAAALRVVAASQSAAGRAVRIWPAAVIWIVISLLVGVTGMPGTGEAGVAWAAHIGGFVAGAILLSVLRLGLRRPVDPLGTAGQRRGPYDPNRRPGPGRRYPDD